ncbi:MAG: hypothetical protein KGN02_03945 [bacterium]|nr:hypothetical protein [bacterium]
MMEIFGTNFAITLGSWRLRFCVALEEIDGMPAPRAATPHRLRVVPEDEFSRRA